MKLESVPDTNFYKISKEDGRVIIVSYEDLRELGLLIRKETEGFKLVNEK